MCRILCHSCRGFDETVKSLKTKKTNKKNKTTNEKNGADKGFYVCFHFYSQK